MRSERHEGFTLAELLVVVTIIGIVAAVAIPAAAPNADMRLDAAAQEVINALRFARIEALRTGTYYGADFSVDPVTSTRRVRVFRTDNVVVMHPLEANFPYDNQLFSGSATAGVTISDATFFYQIGTTIPPSVSDRVAFDADGTPVYWDAVSYPAYSTTPYVSAVTLTYQGNTVRVLLDPVTGRVTRTPT